jgi:hypothetical protein
MPQDVIPLATHLNQSIVQVMEQREQAFASVIAEWEQIQRDEHEKINEFLVRHPEFKKELIITDDGIELMPLSDNGKAKKGD